MGNVYCREHAWLRYHVEDLDFDVALLAKSYDDLECEYEGCCQLPTSSTGAFCRATDREELHIAYSLCLAFAALQRM